MNRTSIKTSWPIFFLAIVFAGASFAILPHAFAATDTGSCATNQDNRALDFWLGEWTIAAPGGSSGATSRVALELDKCVVVERWDDAHGHTGENLFAYSADDKSWHGFFADNDGRVHVFLNGKVSPGSAEFSGPSRAPNGESILNRVTISRINSGQVEQLWQKSSDDGRTWTTAFRGAYTRRQP